jgi:hypothetical protein
VPPADFVLVARQLQLNYAGQGIRCTYDNVKISLSSSCRFEKPCEEIETLEDALFQMTLFDEHGGEITIKLEGKDMFVPGTLIDNDDPSIENFCFIPILKHNYGPDNTWFLGSPILNDYYTVFDMSQDSYLQIGISVKNDEEEDTFTNMEAPPSRKRFDDKWIVLAGVLIMAVLSMFFVCCRKTKVAKVREVS